MGQTLIDAALAAGDLTLTGALEISGSALIGRDMGERSGRTTGVTITADPVAGVRNADVLIDFTRPEGTLANLAACAAAKVGAVVGTTGFSEGDKERMREFARIVPIVFASNMSVGVNVLIKLVEVAAQRLGDDYDVEIVEMHHRHKVDAPSGTALTLGEAAATALSRDLKSVAVYERAGVTGERPERAIGFATLRGGDVVGDHTVIFAGDGERIELTHRAGSRANFARGALRAARFVAQKRNEPRLYDMQDVLGLR
jgi:4-hydroxy-tetrahydrodipicolinate reductase